MRVGDVAYRSIWLGDDGASVRLIDQTRLPHHFEVVTVRRCGEMARAIRDMWIRGAPAIGVAAAYGVALAMQEDPNDTNLEAAAAELLATRPTAVNLRVGVETQRAALTPLAPAARAGHAFALAAALADADVAANQAIATHGLGLLKALGAGLPTGTTLQLLTHCNAGWLATVDHGTALAPIYAAFDAGLDVHVWVDETRPRSQGALLTAWELRQHGVPCTLIADNSGGHLMQRGLVHACIVGADRVSRRGDVCNKIGTYLKALAAHDNRVPFYVALPGSTIDWRIADGVADIPIELRAAEEVLWQSGPDADGVLRRVRVAAADTQARNDAFDVTPARLVTSIITERGVAAPDRLASLYPEHAREHAGGSAG